jgi:hypothetical protein
MWGDNPNNRSVSNMPVQGFGAVVMRRAVDMLVKNGVKVIFTLHDAIYIEYPTAKKDHMDLLIDCMRDAFAYCFPKHIREIAKNIKLDPYTWGPDYETDSEINTGRYIIGCSDKYIDERAVREYEQFKEYYNNKPSYSVLE